MKELAASTMVPSSHDTQDRAKRWAGVSPMADSATVDFTEKMAGLFEYGIDEGDA